MKFCFIFLFLNCIFYLSVAIPQKSTIYSDVPTKIKLMYFDGRGTAEVSRILLKIGGIEFEDHRFPVNVEENGALWIVPEFNIAKSDGEFAVNLNRAPILQVDEIKIGQSRAIEKFIAKKCGLLGENDLQEAQIDCIAENVRDIKDKWFKIRMAGGFKSSPEKDSAMKKWFERGGEYENWLKKLEDSLFQSYCNGFSVGGKLSYADVLIWHLLCDTFEDNKTARKISFKFEKLSAISRRVSQNRNLKNWLKTRPTTIL